MSDYSSPAQPVSNATDALRRKIDEFIEDVGAAVRNAVDIGEILVSMVEAALDGLVKEFGKLWDKITEIVSYCGNPAALEGAASVWRAQIGGIFSELPRKVSENELFADSSWKGVAASRYRDTVPNQREALSSIDEDFAKNIAAGLDSMAQAIIHFWHGVIKIILGLNVAVAGGVIQIATVAGIPTGIMTIIGGVITALFGIIDVQAALGSDATGAKSSLETALADGLNSWPAFRAQTS